MVPEFQKIENGKAEINDRTTEPKNHFITP